MIESVLLGLVTNFIYDGMKSAKCEFLKKDDREISIEMILEEKLEHYNDTALDCDAFYGYLKEAQIKDIIVSFLAYNIYGNYIDNISSKIIFEKKEKVVDFLTDGAIQVEDIKEKNIPTHEIRHFFREIIDICIETMKSKLSDESRVLLFFVNSKIDSMENKIESVLKSKITLENENHRLVCESYVQLLKKNNSIGFIYGIGEFPMYDFYVFPSFELDSNPRVYLKHPDASWDDMKTNRIVRRNYHQFLMHNNFDINWKNLFESNDIVYVVGGPGFGKSLFLKNLINKYEEIENFSGSDCLPIYCDLKLFSEFSKGKGYSITDFLLDCMVKTTLYERDKLNKSFLEYYLNRGRCFILFDALDEVDRNERNELHSMIINYFIVNNNNNKICITCRDKGFIPKQDIEVYKIKSMTLDMIEEYLGNIIRLGYFNQVDKEEFLKQANVLIENGFLNNFLILSLLVSIFKAEKQLPENKIQLYDKCINYISKSREIDKGKTKYDFKLINSLMNDNTFMQIALLSYPNNRNVDENSIKKMMLETYKDMYIDENTANNAVDEFLRFCSERTELLVNSNEESKYKFFHRTFFEYYYAKYIIKEYKNPHEITECLMNFDVDSEIFELYVALLKTSNYDQYKEYINYLINNYSNVDKKASEKFFILTSMMQVVEEQKFLNDYFKLFLKDIQILKTYPNINFSILVNIFRKVFSFSEDNKIAFFEKYKFYLLVGYLKKKHLDWLKEKRREETKTLSDNQDNDVVELNNYMDYYIPFHMCMCKNGEDELFTNICVDFEEPLINLISETYIKDLTNIFNSVNLERGNREMLKSEFKRLKSNEKNKIKETENL